MRRGFGMSIQTIVILVIAVVLLVSLIIFFTSQSGSLFGSIADVGNAADGASDAAVSNISSIG